MDIFPDDEMIDAFGHLTPSLSERNAHFFDKWMEWRSHRMKIKRLSNYQLIRVILTPNSLFQ